MWKQPSHKKEDTLVQHKIYFSAQLDPAGGFLHGTELYINANKTEAGLFTFCEEQFPRVGIIPTTGSYISDFTTLPVTLTADISSWSLTFTYISGDWCSLAINPTALYYQGREPKAASRGVTIRESQHWFSQIIKAVRWLGETRCVFTFIPRLSLVKLSTSHLALEPRRPAWGWHLMFWIKCLDN